MKKSLNWLFDYPNLRLYQYDEGFKFSLDSILLAEFADIKKKDNKIIDLCTGNGVIPTILAWKTHKHIIGVELQKEIYDLAEESLLVNHLEKSITYYNEDVKNIFKLFSRNSFDVVLCNPPYFPYHNDNHVNKASIKKIARHEIMIDLKTIIEIASELLKAKGKFYLVHLPSRIDEIIIYANMYHLAVKEIEFIYSKKNEDATIVLVSLVKDGKYGTKVHASKCIENLSTYQNLFDRKEKEK